ncbi:hypothetical protein Q7P37_001749 [Cladosporium fusiforme]
MDHSTSYTTRTIEKEETRHQYSFSNIVNTGSSRVHVGNVLNIRNYHGPWPDSLPREIQNETVREHARLSGKRRRSVCDDETRPSRGGNPYLDMAISELGEFSMSLKHQKQDKAAQKIVSWIRVILEAIENNCAASQISHREYELERMQNGLLLTNCVGINAVSPRKIPGQFIKRKRNTSFVVFGKWKIVLDTLSWKALDEHERSVTGSFSALRLEPSDSTSASPVAAFFGERTDYIHGTTVIPPTIFAYRTVSKKSEVFRLVKEDDIAGLMKLLAEQKATTRDCDEVGRPLLHYACRYESSTCCAFLIENGADVDAMVVGWNPYDNVTALHTCFHDYQCFTLLLDAGADYTIPGGGNDGTFLPSPLEMLLDNWWEPYSREASNLLSRMLSEDMAFEVPTPDGLSIWLNACRAHAYGSMPESLQMPLDAGCDVHETTKNYSEYPDGWNCLFLFTLHAYDPHDAEELGALQLLLRSSANVFAKDASELTVFDHVNALPMDQYGSYRRDLWYCALQRESIDIGEYLEMYPRVPVYSAIYTPEHYRALCFLEDWIDDEDDGDDEVYGYNMEQQVSEILNVHPWTEEESSAMEPIYRLRRERERRWDERQRQFLGTAPRVVEEVSDSEASEDDWHGAQQVV